MIADEALGMQYEPESERPFVIRTQGSVGWLVGR